jgi:cytochrome bd-type quinol oxidase subunit 1
MISSLFWGSLPVFVFVSGVVSGGTQSYQLYTEYSGSTFFEGFDFFTGPDPTVGFVT